MSDDGNFTALSSVTNNTNAEMPRAYDNSFTYVGHMYYNWYAATAESGTRAMASGHAEDSLCPAGWQLPLRDGAKSWAGLLSGVGGGEVYKLPYSLPYDTEYYHAPLGRFYQTGHYFWSSTVHPYGTYAYNLYTSFNSSPAFSTNDKANGELVRCVQK